MIEPGLNQLGGARILHGAFYVGDAPRLRSLSWLVGMLCVLALIVMAALKVV